MKENTLNFETVHQCNCRFENQTLHPLVSVIDLSKSDLTQNTVKFDFYTLVMLEAQADEFLFGRKPYDYSNATLLFLTPGQSLEIKREQKLPRKGCLLAFHPDLLCRTSLGEHIKNYTFLSYRPDEALHLSLREKAKAEDCLCQIGQELRHAIDCHSKTLITRYIELLLDYCSRFYERQFITRCEANQALLDKTDALLDEYIQSGQLQNGILPTAEYCAGLLHLSPGYFSDLLKFETGKNITEYFLQKRLDASRKMLLDKNNTVSLVARRLGFHNVQYFSYLFKKITGIAPNEYRLSLN